MTKISDQMKGNARQSAANSAPSEGGGDAALALTSTVQGQASEIAIATQAAAISIDHASDKLSDIFAEVMSGRALLNATLAKTQEKLRVQGTIQFDTEVPPITLDLPQFGNLAETRQRFRGLFNPAEAIDPSYILSTPADLADGEHDD